MSRACQRDDLEALIPVCTHWSVDDEGYGASWCRNVTLTSAPVERYHCDNCDLYFEPGDGVGSESIEAAWQRALDHLHVSEAAA